MKDAIAVARIRETPENGSAYWAETIHEIRDGETVAELMSRIIPAGNLRPDWHYVDTEVLIRFVRRSKEAE